MASQHDLSAPAEAATEPAVRHPPHAPASTPGIWRERDRLEAHIRRVVMPLFRQVADAARASGHYGIAAMVVARAQGGLQPSREPFVTGAFLGLAHRQPGWEEDYAGIIRVVPAGGPAFTLNCRAPAFNRTAGASIEEVSEFRLVAMVREIMASAFG